jgi:hypothetical protein
MTQGECANECAFAFFISLKVHTVLTKNEI